MHRHLSLRDLVFQGADQSVRATLVRSLKNHGVYYLAGGDGGRLATVRVAQDKFCACIEGFELLIV
jgi:hypothetical protein